MLPVITPPEPESNYSGVKVIGILAKAVPCTTVSWGTQDWHRVIMTGDSRRTSFHTFARSPLDLVRLCVLMMCGAVAESMLSTYIEPKPSHQSALDLFQFF